MKVNQKFYYDDENHKYYVDGVEKPSVTEICSPISSERLHSLPPQVINNARLRGELCHEMFEDYALLGEIDEDSITPECAPYIEQFILWFRTYRPKVLFTEKQLFGKDFCGTCDLICQIDGKTLLVDYKTTSALDSKSLSCQLEGYYRLCKQNKIHIDECWYLHLKKDSYVFKPIERNERWFSILLEHNKFMKGEKTNGREQQGGNSAKKKQL